MKYITLLIALLVPSVSFAAAFNTNLYYGLQNSSDVRALQEFLTTRGDYSGPITGNFYSLTLTGVKQFQTENNISPVSGYFGILSRGVANSLFVAIAPIEETGTTTTTITLPTPIEQEPIPVTIVQKFGSVSPVNNATPAPLPMVESVPMTPLLTSIFEVSKDSVGDYHLRVETNKPLDFPATTITNGILELVNQSQSTGWFWTNPKNEEVFPSYYYDAKIAATGSFDITIKDLDGKTLTYSFIIN